MSKKVTNKKSIFQYVMDSSIRVHKDECNNYNPPFISYTPTGVLPLNINIENDLKGMTRQLSKCTEKKYQQSKYPFNTPLDIYPHNKKTC